VSDTNTKNKEEFYEMQKKKTKKKPRLIKCVLCFVVRLHLTSDRNEFPPPSRSIKV
jgi:predicted adenine nucleotide alpha hydrolase (AANH) superfamily ATPase